MKTKLGWGETPWDDMTKEELLREVQRMFSALQAAQSIVLQARLGNEHVPFWGPSGQGGRALMKVKAVLTPYEEDDSFREKIYKMFFRAADDLLFPGLDAIRSGWVICDKCQSMVAGMRSESPPETCMRCREEGPKLRPITWADLAPTKEAS